MVKAMIADIKKFSFSEMTSNSTGKTSGSGFCGVFIVVLSTLAFLYGCYEFHCSGKADIMMYCSANILVGAGLLGYRKSMDKSGINTESVSTSQSVPESPKGGEAEGAGTIPS